MPGSSDCVSMLVEGQKQKVQKRLMLYTIKEAYKLFKQQNPLSKIGLTKFMELRPYYLEERVLIMSAFARIMKMLNS